MFLKAQLKQVKLCCKFTQEFWVSRRGRVRQMCSFRQSENRIKSRFEQLKPRIEQLCLELSNS